MTCKKDVIKIYKEFTEKRQNMLKNDMKKKRKNGTIILILTVILFFIALFFAFGIYFLESTWSNLTFDEILFHIKAPLLGTAKGIMKRFIVQALLPSIGGTAAMLVLLLLMRKNRWYRYVLAASMILSALAIFTSVKDAWDNFGIGSYIRAQVQNSDFIDQNYVDPAAITLEFPEKKRNLIYYGIDGDHICGYGIRRCLSCEHDSRTYRACTGK